MPPGLSDNRTCSNTCSNRSKWCRATRYAQVVLALRQHDLVDVADVVMNPAGLLRPVRQALG